MVVLLWVLRIALALFSFAGGAYKLFMFDELATMPAMADLSRGGWVALGAFEMVCGVLLIVPAATRWRPALTPIAAVALAFESFALAALYARHSLALTPTNPLVWVVMMGLMAAFVAYAKYPVRPAR